MRKSIVSLVVGSLLAGFAVSASADNDSHYVMTSPCRS